MDGRTDGLTDSRKDGHKKTDRQAGRQTDRKTDKQAERQFRSNPLNFFKVGILIGFLNLPNYQICQGSSPLRVIHVIHLVDKYGLTIILD